MPPVFFDSSSGYRLFSMFSSQALIQMATALLLPNCLNQFLRVPNMIAHRTARFLWVPFLNALQDSSMVRHTVFDAAWRVNRNQHDIQPQIRDWAQQDTEQFIAGGFSQECVKSQIVL
jgi:hypothetical protein